LNFTLKNSYLRQKQLILELCNHKITLNQLEMKSKQLLLVLLALIIIPAFQCSNAESKKNEVSNPEILIETDFGNIKLVLYDETPEHRDNFIRLIEIGFYKDLLFHRVIQSFMIQGGDPNSRNAQPGTTLGSGGPDYTIPAEIHPHLFHKKGALAAARMGDNVNPEKRSSGSQFYIVQGTVLNDQQLTENENRINNMRLQGLFSKFLEEEKNKAFENDEVLNMDVLNKLAEEKAMVAFNELPKYTFPEEHREVYKTVGGTPHLDGSYTVFGEVTEGLEVLDKIASQATNQANRPLEDIRMNIKILNK
jgi:cyclophilin family peptidyl-prolyl cis-trans isomerase